MKNKHFLKNLGSYIHDNPFTAVRLNESLIVIKPEPHNICFFVNNSGIQVMDPETQKILPSDLKTWEEKTKSRKQFVGSTNLDKDFLHNVITAIWRITEDLHYTLNNTQ